MIKHALAALAAFCFAIPAHAELFSPALYVARDADSTLYLYGTVHVRRPGQPWGAANAEAALASADEVWTEIEMDAGAQARTQAGVAALGRAPADRPLSSWLDEAERARLDALLRRLGAPPALFETMRPWLAAITLSILPMLNSGYDPEAGVDQMIDAIADSSGKQRRAFETAEQQLGFMANLSDEAQRQMLLEAIAETEKGPAELDGLIEAWARGDDAAIERLVVHDTRANYPELYEVLFRARNAAWIDALARELDGAGVDFVAVGAGHIVGDEGLVALLRARGFGVERVR